jgi:hypothetical protein
MVNLLSIIRDIRRKLQDGTLTMLDVVRAINAISQVIIDLADGVPVPMGSNGAEAESNQLELRDEILGLFTFVDGVGSEPDVPVSGPFIDALLPMLLKLMTKLLEKWVTK